MACVRTEKCRRESNVLDTKSIRLYYGIQIWGSIYCHNTHICVCSTRSETGVHITNELHGAAFFLEKLTLPQLVKKFPAFYENRRFITAFTRAHHAFLS
jgi:hypothetical protein